MYTFGETRANLSTRKPFESRLLHRLLFAVGRKSIWSAMRHLEITFPELSAEAAHWTRNAPVEIEETSRVLRQRITDLVTVLWRLALFYGWP